MMKVLAVCGSGMGTSMIMKMKAILILKGVKRTRKISLFMV